MNKRLTAWLGILTSLGLSAAAWSAPLFPDIPERHWATDALATMAAKGLIEGYPDGTFKGDRTATRWETALVVARLMAKMNEAHASFATKSEIAELQKLTDSLRSELDALGAHTDSLEKAVGKLDRRVSDLERITFYGELQARFGVQNVRNKGNSSMGSVLNYNTAVGTAVAAGGIIPDINLANNPFVIGVLGTVDWSSGRPLTSGDVQTMALKLGMHLRISNDFEGGMEFGSYTTMGNSVTDSFWGVQAPYAISPFCLGRSGMDNSRYTKLCLDNFWLRHTPSNTKLVVGYFKDTNFDDFVYVSPLNPQRWGDKYMGNYGAKINGEIQLGDSGMTQLNWELMGTILPNGNSNSLVPDAEYSTHTEGGNLCLNFHENRGHFKLNVLHTQDSASNGQSNYTGLYLNPNYTLNWVNPNGYYINQLDPSQISGVGGYSDVRPIPMINAAGNDGITGVSGVPNVGGFGPQEMMTYGASVNYDFNLPNTNPTIFAEYGHTNYKPNRNSRYTSSGDLFRAGFKLGLLDKKVNLNLEYIHTDPNYDPFILPFQQINGITTPLWRCDGFTYNNGWYSLHDTDLYTHNRKGLRASINWRFLPTGALTLRYNALEQVKTSMQDIRYSANSIAPGTPNTTVLGFSPGFYDPVFCAFSPATFTSDGTNEVGLALENPRGKVTFFGIEAGNKFLFDPKKSTQGIKLSGAYRKTKFTRHSNLSSLVAGDAGIRGEAMNNVNANLDAWLVAMDYDITQNLKMRLAFTSVDLYGQLDPMGITGNYAVERNLTSYNLLDMEQRIPEISFEWDATDRTTFGVVGRLFYVLDHVDNTMKVNPRVPAVNVDLGNQANGHPFNWQAYQISTYMNMKF